MNLGTKIKQLREQNKLSQYELSDILEISQTSLHNIESGNSKKIDFNLVDKMCKYFGVEFEYFLEYDKYSNYEKVEKSNINCKKGIINNFPESIIEQITKLINDSKVKDLKILELEERINKYVNNSSKPS